MPARAATIAFLMTPAGRALLAEAASLPADRLTRIERLRRRYPPPLAAAAVQMWELRQRARHRFQHADTMLFTPEGLEQSTGDRIAAYRATRFPDNTSVLDACCGIGGDARALASRGPTVAVEIDPATALCAQANLIEAPFPSMVLCTDITTLELSVWSSRGIRAAFFDPSRRQHTPHGTHRRLVRDVEHYAPPLSFLHALRTHFPALGVKVSPAVPDSVLQAFPEARVEFLSDQGECKEAVLWFGPLAEALPPTRTATILRPDLPPQRITAVPVNVGCGPPGAYLYEPDPAVIRAGAHRNLAAQLQGRLIAPEIAYLTTDRWTPTPFGTAYRVLDSLPYTPREAQAWLRRHGARLIAIKKRGVPHPPEIVRRRLQDAGDIAVILVLCPHRGRTLALFCQPVETSATLSAR